MIEYLSVYGFLPPVQAVIQVIELLKKEHITVWSGWQYLAESIRETDRRSWLQRLPELAFGVVLPDEQWEQARQFLQTVWNLEAFARDCGYAGAPFRWDEERRFVLHCELDAAYFHLYGIAREDVAYIMETFRVWREKEVK
jgi:hypothetical protein